MDFGETSDDEDVDETFFFFSLSLWRARRNGEEIAPRSFSLPSFLLLSLLLSARVLLSGDRKATNTDCFLREEERACVVMRIRNAFFHFFIFCFCPQRHLFKKRRPFLTFA